jgi:GTP-binding protein YchF
MRIALLGLPQSGKRTLFTLLTDRQVPEGRKPGECIEGVATIRDGRVDSITKICNPERTIYAENTYVLCPDIVTDAPSRDWLDAAGRCDLLCLVLRAFPSDQVYHPAGSVDAARDREALSTELLLADMTVAETRLARLEKEKRAGLSADQKLEEATVTTCMTALENGQPISTLNLGEQEARAIRSLPFVTSRPTLFIYNVGEDEVGSDHGDATLPVSVAIEAEVMQIEDPAERGEFLAELGLESSGLDRVNAAAYAALGLMSFYTMGKDEARAWTIRTGSSAPVAGGKIHSDIERGFIRVEIIKFTDLVETGSEKAAKEQGKMQLKGKDYVMEDGDICHFLFNV